MGAGVAEWVRALVCIQGPSVKFGLSLFLLSSASMYFFGVLRWFLSSKTKAITKSGLCIVSSATMFGCRPKIFGNQTGNVATKICFIEWLAFWATRRYDDSIIGCKGLRSLSCRGPIWIISQLCRIYTQPRVWSRNSCKDHLVRSSKMIEL